MKLDNVGEVIATRTLVLLTDQGPPSDVLVVLGKPAKIPDHSEYCCPYQIKGAGFDKVMAIYGIDPFQAIQLALSTLAVEIEVLNKKLRGKLRWECGREGDLGFPISS